MKVIFHLTGATGVVGSSHENLKIDNTDGPLDFSF